MKQIIAWEDSNGQLYKSQSNAAKAEFTNKILGAASKLPKYGPFGSHRLDMKHLADCLYSTSYESFKVQIREAINWLDDYRKVKGE